MKRRLRRLPPLTFRYSRWLLLMLFPVVKCQARRTERLIAELAMSGMGVAPADISTLVRAACHFWKHRVFVYAGINNSLPRLPGFAIPARYRQPILVQLRDIYSDKIHLSFDRFQLVDSDFV